MSAIQKYITIKTIVSRRKKVPWFDKEVQRAIVKKMFFSIVNKTFKIHSGVQKCQKSG